jgi:hypothetical protein
MWSGPRNISTAMMRSFGNRPDTFVCDEPLYAHYLVHTRLPHPGADEVIRHHESDWRRVVDWLTGPITEGKTVFYQKHMAHHLLPHIDREWLDALDHAFLIRDPARMLSSLVEFLPHPTLADTGLPQQVEIFERVERRTGRPAPVVDASDVVARPEATLRRLCAALDLEFTPAMLTWPAAPRAADGVWAKHWYSKVERSSGFAPQESTSRPLDPAVRHVAAECARYYERLAAHRLT